MSPNLIYDSLSESARSLVGVSFDQFVSIIPTEVYNHNTILTDAKNFGRFGIREYDDNDNVCNTYILLIGYSRRKIDLFVSGLYSDYGIPYVAKKEAGEDYFNTTAYEVVDDIKYPNQRHRFKLYRPKSFFFRLEHEY